VISERDILGTQLVRRNDELALVILSEYGKLHVCKIKNDRAFVFSISYFVDSKMA
jgi:hypothetical protein